MIQSNSASKVTPGGWPQWVVDTPAHSWKHMWEVKYQKLDPITETWSKRRAYVTGGVREMLEWVDHNLTNPCDLVTSIKQLPPGKVLVQDVWAQS